MRRAVILLVMAMLILSACAPVAAPTATVPPVSSETPAPSATPAPTATPTRTPTVTPTPIPTLPPEQVGGLEGVPDPRVSNPELFDLTRPDAPIPQFVNAMRMAGIGIDPQEVGDNLEFRKVKRRDGREYIIAYTQNTGDEFSDQIPILIYEREEGWNEATPKKIAEINSIRIGILYGGFILRDPNYFGSSFVKAAERFNLLTESHMSFQTPIEGGKFDLHRKEDNFNFYIPDLTFRYAIQHNKMVIFSPLLGGNANVHIPDWLKAKETKDEFLSAISNHVRTVVKHYSGHSIPVAMVLVNEYFGNPFQNTPEFKFFKQKANSLGISDIEFMSFVFRTAKESNPQITFIFNEYGMEIPGSYNYVPRKDQQIYELLWNCLQRDVPIDAIGFQMHLYGKDFYSNFDGMISNFRNQIQKYQRLGLDIYITELDVRLDDMPNVPLEEKLKLQGRIYEEVIRVAIEEGVSHINIWGVSDWESWLNNPDLTGSDYRDTKPLIYDDDNRPKPAYYGVIKGLLGH